MYLSNKTIKEYIESGKIKVTGDIQIESIGISMHLGNELLIPRPYQVIDSKNPIEIEYLKYNLEQAPYVLKPNEFVLGSTKEIVFTDKDIITMIDGRSTYARLGMSIHISAMVLDGLPFNEESSVLEIKNMGNFNILLHQFERVGTYVFAQLSTSIEGKKESPYINQNGVTPPKF
ncbi:MAG: deoxycytidine triphosphate deaminase, dCTP deaminase [candidate division WS6 bacterium GW2011_GWC1_33_20]|uniref:Deoxycytidine triphosphate deaminase, dCTP deaminase n=2 Tax=Candidatus Dojkabacteria TaxID=74243 RepID=A0A0F9ZIC0_9BACT|nr:MAG: deoxycytidine triphosphate deaminase, dCTP deaminase [candidate division WS6 bacterium GW2011_GWE2_33_157]KKP43948.1 MAG: deoxycytidine triphosphate deaminase, dCTP deaminase [candidate division WS6 bacterium GW2011_GWC1_33_20]KKP45687.1 MAG: deoxycytidine triphosphate deaminase, dCTP deaminase [candidate division WS6 bacterium GW2011_GWF1_33_233]KKP55052.1 MAG: deoxycytidine triphosphate deaminase, dCTP deaminase [candidate division WS6 bacterium GW2011_WS6_33_547]KKP55247.1 MAG: putat